MNLTSFLSLIRFTNVLLVILTQYLVGYFVLWEGFAQYGLHPYLNQFEFFLLVLCTGLITAGGNVVNDLYDIEIDKVNKPNSQIVGRKVSLESTYRIYLFITGIGALIAVYLAMQLGRLSLFAIYPLAVGLLWIYSRWFKRLPLSGNIIIAIFTTCVPLILLIPEWKNVIEPSFRTSIYFYITIGFSLFAGLMTLVREIVKDMEDYKGDKSVGAVTLPVAIGVTKTKRLLYFLVLTIFFFLGLWVIYFYHKLHSIGILFYSLLILILHIYTIFRLVKAREFKDYAFISMLIKLLMILGLFYLFFI